MSSNAQRLREPIATLETILRLEAIRLAALHQRLEARGLADPVTGILPTRVAVAHLRRLWRHRQEVAALAGPVAEDAQTEAGPSAGRAGRRGDRPKRRRRPAATAPTSADARLTSTAEGAAPKHFDKTNPPRAGAEIPDESGGAPATEGPARAQPANLALLGLAMLML